MTKFSKELQDALDAAEDACLEAVGHVGQHNSADRESEARERVLTAFTALAVAIEAEPSRRMLTLWREAVAKGETTLGFEEWRKHQGEIDKWRADQ